MVLILLFACTCTTYINFCTLYIRVDIGIDNTEKMQMQCFFANSRLSTVN